MPAFSRGLALCLSSYTYIIGRFRQSQELFVDMWGLSGAWNEKCSRFALQKQRGLQPMRAFREQPNSHPQRLSKRMRISAEAEATGVTSQHSNRGRSENAEDAKSEDYSSEMQSKMGGFLTYRHEDGMNFAHVLDNMIVGSCLQTPEDLDRLVQDEGVGSILCLQQDSDMEYFDLDIKPILERAEERGDVQHVRYRINDFDAFDLRMKLPGAAVAVAQGMEGGRKIYIHCTAGLGRAPATALAYMYWFQDYDLNSAFAKLRAVRPCNPRLQAIRQATCDVLVDQGQRSPVLIAVSRPGSARHIQVAGLDFGWGNPQEMHWDPCSQRFVLERTLPVGLYPYKFIYDGRWTISADHPTLQDGENINNYLEVVGDSSDPLKSAMRERLSSETGTLTDIDRMSLQKLLRSL